VAGLLVAIVIGATPSMLALLALLFAYALSLLAEGPGSQSLDHALAERARRRAIEQDPLWTRPPYVAG
jgi:hypothetical protein